MREKRRREGTVHRIPSTVYEGSKSMRLAPSRSHCCWVFCRGSFFGAKDHTMQLLFLAISPSFIGFCKRLRCSSFKEVTEAVTQTLKIYPQGTTSCCIDEIRKKKCGDSLSHLGRCTRCTLFDCLNCGLIFIGLLQR